MKIKQWWHGLWTGHCKHERLEVIVVDHYKFGKKGVSLKECCQCGHIGDTW